MVAPTVIRMTAEIASVLIYFGAIFYYIKNTEVCTSAFFIARYSQINVYFPLTFSIRPFISCLPLKLRMVKVVPG